MCDICHKLTCLYKEPFVIFTIAAKAAKAAKLFFFLKVIIVSGRKICMNIVSCPINLEATMKHGLASWSKVLLIGHTKKSLYQPYLRLRAFWESWSSKLLNLNANIKDQSYVSEVFLCPILNCKFMSTASSWIWIKYSFHLLREKKQHCRGHCLTSSNN